MNKHSIVYEMHDNDQDKYYIAHLIDEYKILIKTFEYYLLGHFSKMKNIWTWCNKSIQTDTIVKNKTKHLRNMLIDIDTENSQFTNFVKNDTSILSRNDLEINIKRVSKMTEKQCVFDDEYDNDIMTILLIDKILINNQ